MAAISRQTMEKPCAAIEHILGEHTKCGVGLITFMTYCIQTGMLSMGVVLPESSIITSNTGIDSRPNWAIVAATVPRAMPSAATVTRKRRRRPEKQIDPAIGTRSHHWTTSAIDIAAASNDDAIGEDLREHDLGGNDGHDEQMLDRTLLALANERGAGEHDGNHGEIADDLHH